MNVLRFTQLPSHPGIDTFASYPYRGIIMRNFIPGPVPAALALLLVMGGCAEEVPVSATPDEVAAVAEVAPITAGTDARIMADGEEVTTGTAVFVRRADGSEVPGVWRGPRKLLDVYTDGTLIFSEEGLPARVVTVQEGQTIEAVTEG